MARKRVPKPDGPTTRVGLSVTDRQHRLLRTLAAEARMTMPGYALSLLLPVLEAEAKKLGLKL